MDLLYFLQTLFDEGWHQIRLLVTEEDVTLHIDDQQIEIKPLHPVVGIFISGQTQIGKYSGKEETVQVINNDFLFLALYKMEPLLLFLNLT